SASFLGFRFPPNLFASGNRIFPSRPNLDRTFRQFTSFNLPFRDRHFSPSQTRRDSCTRDISQFASIISCIRAIILSSICCPPTFTDPNLQNHFSRVQQKMRDTKSSQRRGGRAINKNGSDPKWRGRGGQFGETVQA